MNIVILSFDLPQHTEKAVISCLRFKDPSEIILVHNGSSAKNVQNLKTKFPQIRHLTLSQNQHFSGGANAGINFAFQLMKSSLPLQSETQSNLGLPEEHDTQDQSSLLKWVLFITNDCSLEQIGSRPFQAGLWAPLIFARSKNRIDSLGAQIRPMSFKLRHCRTDQEFNDSQFRYVPGTAFWIDEQTWIESKGFDTSLQTYWEDVDLSLRLQQQKLHIGLHSQTQILHGIGKTCHSNSYYTSYLFQRNRKKIIQKYSPFKVFAYSVLLFDIMSIAFRSLRRRDFQKLKLLKQAVLE